MIKYGVKLWSNNSAIFFQQAVRLIDGGEIDFVELYVHPEMTDLENLAMFKNKKITIHSTHHEHGFDIFNLDEASQSYFRDKVIKAADFFGSEFIILHSGTGDSKEIFKENLEKISDSRIIIENLPKISLDNKLFFGYSLDQLKWIKKNCDARFCLDFSHAVKSAKSQDIDYKEFIDNLFNIMNPAYFHICDGFTGSEIDEHLDLGAGNQDLSWIKNKLVGISREQDINLVFEAPKNADNLDNDIKNINYFKNL